MGCICPSAMAEMVLKLLLEGNSVSSVERITGVHHTTILKLLVLAGESPNGSWQQDPQRESA